MQRSEGVTVLEKWFSLELANVFKDLESRESGLTESEVKLRLEKFGPNRLTPPAKKSAWIRFFMQFHNLIIYILLVSAALTAVLAHWIDAGVIFGVVIINAVIGFIQEGKAEKALEAIRNMLSLEATVIRDGERRLIPAEFLVPGDVVFLESGDKVPADLRLFKVKNLRIDEASLTGESVPVEKSIDPVSAASVLGDRINMTFSGTLVTYGQARGIVTATGDKTEIGRINYLVTQAQSPATRLLLKFAQFGRWLTVTIGVVTLITFIFGVLIRKYALTDMFLASVGLAVAAIPEGLPAILSITMAIGVQRMAKRNVIIRRLPSVETLGSVTVICSDKTGTLTSNEMTVKNIQTATDAFEVSGLGYEPQGSFTAKGKELHCHLLDENKTSCSEYPHLVALIRGAALCNDASLSESQGRWLVAGDPTEGALLVLARKAGLDLAGETLKYPRIDSIPFESELQFMATLNRTPHGKSIFVKGAPERILELCQHQRELSEDKAIESDFWQAKIHEIAASGQRPLAVACRETDEKASTLNISDLQNGFSFLGIVGIIDPPRGSAISAVRQCQNAGIRVKMITGDHVLTARSIGMQMGIGDGTTAITGRELDTIDDQKLSEIVKQVDVFARVSPEHKLRLVKALQANGEVVAMTGDGVNDAPALKRADIGVAMGIKGTEAAKEAAEMVLTDDNFASITHAVEEGRTVYENIKKAVTFILPTNVGEAGIIIAAIIFGRALPITPVQILWINMITAVTLALSLAFEPPESGTMNHPPRDSNSPLLTPFLIWRVGFVALILVVGTFGLFVWERGNGADINLARAIAVNTLVCFEVFYLINTRHLKQTSLTLEGLFGNSYALAAIGLVIFFQMVFTYAPFMQKLFDVAPIGIAAWIRIILLSAFLLILVEMEKYLLRKFWPDLSI
jgi:magnesium-transporting ATPase (P-type)